MAKKILVTGSNGLLGQKIINGYKNDAGVTLVATARGANRILDKTGYVYREMDISNREQVFAVLAEEKPDAVINTAAMTNVDACELDHEACDRLNVTGVNYLAQACSQFAIHLIHLSTDFIFDGKAGPYREDDKPAPLSYYGESKLKSEEIVRAATCPWSIVRTVLVIGIAEGMSRSNIVLWAKGALEKGESIHVVTDQYRTPTLAEDLAAGCMLIAVQGATGIYNISGKDFMSIYELVQHVAEFWNLERDLIHPSTSEKLNQPAKRPPVTGFQLDKAMDELGYRPHAFREALELMDAQITALRS
jgi:dTDP-4-dehydrorhamnose reductase